MAKDIPIGNGSLLISFDADYTIRDWYYPLVGQENHTAGHRFHMGVWVDGVFRWVHDPAFERTLRYQENTLATNVELTCQPMGLTIWAQDVVDFREDVLIRCFRIRNHTPNAREVRLFLHHDFHVYGVDVGDTAFYDPMSHALVHYKGRRYFLMSGIEPGQDPGIESWATGRKEVQGLEGTWRDAEDGILEGEPITQGSVDSTLALTAYLGPNADSTLYSWVAAGKTLEEVRALNGLVSFETPQVLMERTRAFWALWLKRRGHDSEDTPPFDDLCARSLLILRTNLDNHGGIVAANDSDIVVISRDSYSYVWPRDGAFVSRALDEAGYPSLSERFFNFLAPLLDPGGYFAHKYNPNGSLSSSWHPWILHGRPELPIQEDETGTVLWAMWQHFRSFRNVDQAETWLNHVVLPAGQFLTDFRHPETDLPWPSWDLWEERWGIHTFTTAAVWAGLMAAGHFAKAFGREPHASLFHQAAEEIRAAALARLVNPETGLLYRGVRFADGDPKGTLVPDPTPDASLLLLPQLGFLAPDHPVMEATADWIMKELWVPGVVGGLARYSGDRYHRGPDVPSDVPGNPWFISTLWMADYLLMHAHNAEQLAKPAEIIAWVKSHARLSGVLSEQLHPVSGEPISVMPLTWSHATLVATIHRYWRVQSSWERRPTTAHALPSIGY